MRGQTGEAEIRGGKEDGREGVEKYGKDWNTKL